MAINFTDSPSDGDTITANGTTYTYRSASTKWEITASSIVSSNVYLVDGGTATSVYTNGDLVLDGGSA